MAHIQTDNLTLGYEIHGRDFPIIFIAGLGYGRWLWHKQISALQDHYQLILMDNRGVGESDAPPGPYSIKAMTEDVRDLLKALKIEKAHVVGASLGGFIAQELVLDYPELVEKLILISSTAGGPKSKQASFMTMLQLILAARKKDTEQRLKALLKPAVSPQFFADSNKVEELIHAYSKQKADPAAIKSQQAAGQRFWRKEHRSREVENIKNPTLIITGEQDAIVPPENSIILAESIAQGRKKLIPQSGHFPMWESPDTLNGALKEFLME